LTASCTQLLVKFICVEVLSHWMASPSYSRLMHVQ
jgi:hypothetical protein